jgi:hypothetical protein
VAANNKLMEAYQGVLLRGKILKKSSKANNKIFLKLFVTV